MATDYGTDISTFAGPGGSMDIDPMAPTISGLRVVAEAVARLWLCPRGRNPAAPNDGIDVRDWLSMQVVFTSHGLADLEAALVNEALKDERVDSCSVALTYNAATSTLTINASIDAVSLDGTTESFTFVLNVSAVTAQLIFPEAA